MREALADVMRLLYKRGLIQIKGGNASVLSEGLVLITPSQLPKHLLSAEDIAVMDMSGKTIAGKPSSEYRLHLEIYRRVPRARAVVHAHPPSLLALVEKGERVNVDVLMEAKVKVKCVPLVPPYPPGSLELAVAAAESLTSGCNAAVLMRHGAVAVGDDPYDALDTLEALEDAAKIALLAGPPGFEPGTFGSAGRRSDPD